MSSQLRRVVAIAVAMLAASGLSAAMKPTQRIADQAPRIDLEQLIPTRFVDWQIDPNVVPVQISPDVRAKLSEIYSETLSRTYVNGKGDRIMLSVAYGGDQSDAMQVHKPEVCYPAQGFQVVAQMLARLATTQGEVPVKRLVATQGLRVEPITYWIKVGDKVTATGAQWKLTQLSYGLTGKIPDGLIFRVSSIDRDANHAYEIQDAYIRALLDSLSASQRARLVGFPEPPG